MSKLGPISHILSPVSCDSLVLQGLRCKWGAGVFNLVLSLSLSHTGQWKFNMAPHGKELSENLKKIIVAPHKDGIGYKKIAKTLKLSCSMVAKNIQRFKRIGSTQNRPRHGRPKKLSSRAQRHIQRLCLGNRRMSDASIEKWKLKWHDIQPSILTHTCNLCSAFTHPSAHTQQWTHTHCEHTPGAVGSHLCYGTPGAVGDRCLAQGHLVVVLKVERALYIHSTHRQYLPDRDSNSQPFDYESNSLQLGHDFPAAEVEVLGGQPVSAQTIQRTLHQICLHGCHPRRKPLLTNKQQTACWRQTD